MADTDADQADLFAVIGLAAEASAEFCGGVASAPPLAIPCGFRDRRNAPCRRLASRPVTIDGAPFHHRGHRLLHCDPACCRGGATGSIEEEATGDR